MGDLIPVAGGSRAVVPPPGQKPVVVLLGMPRSGLSLCARVLGMLGIDFSTPADRGAGGDDLVALQDEVLELFDRRVETPMHDYPMPPAWWADSRVRSPMNRMREALAGRLQQGGPCGLGDPRMAKLMPLWTRIFTDLGVVPQYVVCLRDPAQVAQSLRSKDGLDLDTGELRALDHAVDCLRYTSGQERVFVRHAEWAVDPFAPFARLQAFIGTFDGVQVNDLEVALQALIRPQTGWVGQPIARQPVVRHFFELVYTLIDRGGTDAGLTDRLRAFTDNYIAFRQLLGPFEAKLKAALASADVAGPLGREERAQAPVAEPVWADASRHALELERDAARAAQQAAEQEASHLRAVLAEAEAAQARLERAAVQAEAGRLRAVQDGEAARSAHATLRQAHARLEQRMAQGELAHAKAVDDLVGVRAAHAEAVARAARLETTLLDHAVALSDTLASLARAEAAHRAAEDRLRSVAITAESAQAEAERLRRERDAAPAPRWRRRW